MTNKSIPSYQFAPENASGIAREWSGIGSAKSRKLFTLLFCFLFIGVGNVWGADNTVTWTATSGSLGSGIGSGTITTGTFNWSYTRTLSSGESYTGWSSNCVQLGKNGGVENITFTTSNIPGTIKSVSVECASYNGAHKVGITVGGTTYLANTTSTSSWTTVSTKSGTGTSSGTIVISFTGGSRALYIKSISVKYELVSASISLEDAGSGSIPSGTFYAGDSYTLPTTAASCAGKVLVGWSTVAVSETDTKPASNYYAKGTSVTLGAGTNTFYAVYAKQSDSGTEAWISSSLDALTGSDIFVFAVNVSGTYYAMPNNASSAPALTSITVSAGKITSSVATTLKWNISGNASSGYVFYPNGSTTTWMYCNTTNASGSNDNIRVGTGSRKAWKVNGDGYLYNDDNTTRYFSRNGTTDFRSYVNTSYNPIVPVVFKNEIEYTYTKYSTSCCTNLGSINGSVSWSNGTSATLTWDKMSHVDATTPYTITCKVTGGSSAGSVGDVDLTGDKATCTITSLTAGTSYDFKIAVTAASNYCDKDSTMTSRAPKITATTDANLVDATYAEGSGPSTNASYFTFSGVGLTGDVTVTAPTNFLVSKTSSSSGFDGSVTVSPSTGSITNQKIWIRLVSGLTNASSPYGGNVALSGGGAATVNVAITGSVSSACTAPTVATPILTSIASGTITPSCASVTVDENCDVTDYGFVWKASSDPTIDDNKTSLGDETPASAFSSDLSISFTTGNTYKIKAYAINSAGTTLSSSLTVTPQKVTFNSNGGSDVATAYVNNGGTVSQPSNPTKTHYTFGGWYTDNGTWASAVNFSSTITADKTYYAKWNPVSYTITTSGLTNVAPTSDFPTSFTYTGSTTTDLNRTLAVDGDNFFLPDALTVTMGGATLTAGTDYTYSNSTGAFTFDVTITGNVVISGSAVAKLKSIAITTDPTKKVYFAGEAFSNTGAVVTATMGDETTKAVSGSAVWTPSGALTAEASKTMTATYTERGISKTATTTVDVYSVTVNKVNEDGDAISADGVTATWTVGTKSLAAGIGSTNYVFKEWAFVGSNNGLSISSTTSANTTITGTPTGNVTIKAVFYKPVAVTWTVNGESYTTGTPTDYVKRGTQWKNLTLPDAPDDDALESGCDVNKFMGWTNMAEHWVGVTHDDAPTVCLKSFSGVTTVINDPIEFKAVYAKEDVEPGSSTLDITYDSVSSGYASTDFTRKGFTFKRSGDIGGFTCSSYKYIQFKDGKSLYNDTELPGKIKSITTVFYPISSCGSGSDGSGTIYAGSSAKPTTNSNSIKTTSDYTTTINYADNTDYTYFAIVATNTLRLVSISVTYADDIVDHSDYITLCSSTNITIGDPSITGEGEITFNQESPVPTCLAGQTITATVTPDAGYECTVLSFTGGSVSVSPTISDVLPLTEETAFELSFAKDANGTLATSATFSPKAVTDWTWTYGGEAIPNPVNLYVGEKAQFNVSYEPSDVITAKKTYTRTKVDAYINWVGDVYANYFYCSGKASTGESTTTVTVTHADGPTQNIYIKVKPLPTVTFVDNVHNLTDFTNWGTDGVVASTASSGVITHTKVTPSHDNIDEPGTGNTCEKQHLHLVGWIRSDYDKVADYMDGTTSDKPTESDILSAGTDGKGLEYFFAPNASINIETYNGLTFYAVWALVE